jgi:WD40 repeat protein
MTQALEIPRSAAPEDLWVPQQSKLNANEPWPGLDAFREQDSHYFAARSDECDELVERVLHRRLTVLYGLSGLGKTSLIEAAVFPELRRRQCLPVAARLNFDPAAPPLVEQVFAAVARGARVAKAEFPVRRNGETLWEYFHRENNEFWSARNRRLTPVLVLDQFEEIFTLGSDRRPDESRAFFDAVADLAEGRPNRAVKARLDASSRDAAREFAFGRHGCLVLLSLREDYLAQLDDHLDAIPSLAQNRMRLRPFNGLQAAEAVRKPGGKLVGDAVVAAIVSGLASDRQRSRAPAEQEIDPALLCLWCRELNKRRIENKKAQITIDLLSDQAREQILSAFYQRGTAKVSESTRYWIEDNLLLASGQRDTIALETALREGVPETEIETLVEERLLRKEERGRVVRVELTHDVLTGVVRQSRDERALRDEREADERARKQQLEDELKRLKGIGRKIAVVAALFFLTVLVYAWWEADHARIRAVEARWAAEQARTIAVSGHVASQAMLLADPALKAQPEVAPLLAVASYQISPGVQPWRSLIDLQRRFARVNRLLRAPHGSTRVAVGPDGVTIVAGTPEGELVIWDTTSHQYRSFSSGRPSPILAVAVSPDGRSIVSGTQDGTVVLWDMVTSIWVALPKGHDGAVQSVAFSRNGRLIVSGSEDQTLVVWDVASREAVGEPLRGHDGAVLSLAFGSDDETIVSGSRDGSVALWKAANRSWSRRAKESHKGEIRSIAFAPDGKTIALGNTDGAIITSNAVTLKKVGEALHGHGGPVQSVSFSPVGKTLVSAGSDGTLVLWDTMTQRRIGESLRGHKGPVKDVTFTQDGQHIVSSSDDGALIIWNATVNHPFSESVSAHEAPVQSIAFSPDGKTLVTASEDGTLRLWETATRKWTGTLEGHQGQVQSVAFSRDGKSIVSGSWDGTLILWDVATLKRIGEPFRGHKTKVLAVAVSPDGSRIVSGDFAGTVILWDTTSQKEIAQIGQAHEGGVSSLAFNPLDGTTIATGGYDHTVRLWDATTLQSISHPFGVENGHKTRVQSIAFSPDGNKIVSGSLDETIIIWDLQRPDRSGERLRGHKSGVQSVAFSPKGDMIASVAGDGMLILWDANTRQPLEEPLSAHKRGVVILSVAFAPPDGKTIASSDDDGSLILWDIDPASWQRKLCAKLPNNLSKADWSRYIGNDIPYTQKQCAHLPEPA